MRLVEQRNPGNSGSRIEPEGPERHEAVVRLLCGHCRRGLGKVFGTVEGGIRSIYGPNEGSMPYARSALAAGYRPPTDYTPSLQQVLDWTAGRLLFRCHQRCPGSGDHPVRRDKLDAAFRQKAALPRKRDRVIVLPVDLGKV
jgi:hypothetical protein